MDDTRALALEYLGSGYDLSGKYADGVSIKRRIFDLDRVLKKDIRQLPNPMTNYFIVTGESVKEYQDSFSNKAGISGSYGLFSGSVERSFSKEDLSISESSFVSIQLCMRYETWKLQTTATEYMYPDVVEDFKTKDGKWLIEQYGGGVVKGLDIGGRWMDNFTVSKLYQNSTNTVAFTMEAAYSGIGSGKGGSEVTKAVESEESIVSRRVNVIGGDPALPPEKLDEWQKSVESTPAFMDFTPDGLVAIWELFPEHEEKLKKGFEEYVEEHQLKIEKKTLLQGMHVHGHPYTTVGVGVGANTLQLYKPAISDGYS